jgi:hypothetical protein
MSTLTSPNNKTQHRPQSGIAHISITGLFYWIYQNSSPFLLRRSARGGSGLGSGGRPTSPSA